MDKKFLPAFLILSFVLALLPHASAQLEIPVYNITYALQKNGINITEVILFSNPEKSTQHTFMEDIVLARQGAAKESIAISGMQSSISKDGTLIYLYFSKDWLIKPSTRMITISYFIPSTQPVFAAGDLESLRFSGRLLLSLPFVPKEANAIVKTPDGYEFGETFFGTRKKTGAHEEILYDYRGETIKANPVIELEYGNFKTAGEGYAKTSKTMIEEAKKKTESVNQTLLLSASYNLTFPDVENKLKETLKLLNASQYYLSFYSAAAERENFYAAFAFANLSKTTSQKALDTAEESGSLLNIKFQTELREKLAEMERLRANLTSINLTPATIIIPQYQPQEKQNISAEALLSEKPPAAIQPQPVQGIPSLYYFAFVLLAVVLGGAFYFVFFVFLKREKEGREEKRQTDFFSIEELKRKKFGDFEKKIAKVRNEGEIAEEIMKLRSEKEKYELAVQNLEKKLSAYEISEHEFLTEKEKFEKKIRDTELKINELESEIKPK